MSLLPQSLSVGRADAPYVRRYKSFRFTVTGIVFAIMMSFMGLAGQTTQANLLVAVFGIMAGILLLCWFFGGRMLRGLSVQRVLPEHGVVGQPILIQYEMRNQKRIWPAMALNISEVDGVSAFYRQPRGFVLHLTGNGTASTVATVLVKRRGVYHLDRLQISSSFPFGFIKQAVNKRLKESVLIYPPIGQVDQHLVRMCRPTESAGTRMRPLRGGTDEFYGVKEYRAGENPRWIYWRRSARTGTLVTKEMSHVSPPRLLLLVDTHDVLGTVESRSQVERVIAMAASLASSALDQGVSVGLVAWSDEWMQIVPNRGKRHRRDLLTGLARLPANDQHSQDLLIEEGVRQIKSGTTAVLLTAAPKRQSLADSARGRTLVLSPGDPRVWKMFNFEKTVDFFACGPVDQQA
jgi:uncharacterized protein (DUF58 family)